MDPEKFHLSWELFICAGVKKKKRKRFLVLDYDKTCFMAASAL